MADSPPITSADYYEFFPPAEHRVGDIWVDLPTFGMLGVERVTGIVITPACDLQNCKAETITYLPVVPIRQAFVLLGLLPVILKAVNGQAHVLGVDGFDDSSGPFVRPDPGQIDAFVARVKEKAQGSKVGDKEKLVAGRAMAGASILRNGSRATAIAASGNELRTLFGASNFETMIERLVTNSYKGDMQFLPSDGQRAEWSAIPEPSIALFRHVFSAPIEIFDCAQDVLRTDWEHETKRMASRITGVASFASCRPMKRQTLKPRFAADLLTRYVAMHVRLGAPDFTDASISAYVAQVIGAGK